MTSKKHYVRATSAAICKLLSREEIVTEARQVIAETRATRMGQMGMVMHQLMAKLKGRADGRLVNQVVREMLAG